MIIVDSFSVLYLTQTNKDFYHSISNLLHMDSGVSIAINYKEEDLSQKGTLTNKQLANFYSLHTTYPSLSKSPWAKWSMQRCCCCRSFARDASARNVLWLERKRSVTAVMSPTIK